MTLRGSPTLPRELVASGSQQGETLHVGGCRHPFQDAVGERAQWRLQGLVAMRLIEADERARARARGSTAHAVVEVADDALGHILHAVGAAAEVAPGSPADRHLFQTEVR